MPGFDDQKEQVLINAPLRVEGTGLLWFRLRGHTETNPLIDPVRVVPGANPDSHSRICHADRGVSSE